VAYGPRHEFILFATKNNQHQLRGTRPQDILRYQRITPLDLEHPAQKPIDLYKELILNSTDEGAIVLDPYLGSGTTLSACRQTNRNGIGIEIDPKYESLIQRRIMANQIDLRSYKED